MPLGIFVSATSKDMEPDCRPAVLKAFRYAEVRSVSMESWMADYSGTVEQCKEKLGASSHYVGVFGYWRGWVPAGGTASITEIEFEEAYGGKPHSCMALFLPKEDSDISDTLFLRAARLHAADLAIADASERPLDALLADARIRDAMKDQEAFLRRVCARGIVEHFDEPVDLALRVERRARSWAQPLRQLGREGERDAAEGAHPAVPGEAQLAQLGREPQLGAFRETLAAMAVSDAPEVACFVVHGPADHGQQSLARRLAEVLESSTTQPPAAAVVPVGALWRRLGMKPLLDVIGSQLELDAAGTVEQLAAGIGAARARTDVVIIVHRVHLYPDGLAGFVSTFWTPLVAALDADAEHRLVCIATAEATLDDAAPAAVPGAHDPARPVVLPVLGPFTRAELALWLRGRLARREAAEMADALIETTDGVPSRLFAELANPSNWIR